MLHGNNFITILRLTKGWNAWKPVTKITGQSKNHFDIKTVYKNDVLLTFISSDTHEKDLQSTPALKLFKSKWSGPKLAESNKIVSRPIFSELHIVSISLPTWTEKEREKKMSINKNLSILLAHIKK